ncbi:MULTISPECIES: hypothetical protein [Desulfitobacterium]|uniref:Uncharacterized protein n=1 Tax=Desulfitobacterium dehalogenans (strain ATCC 51507 / DSM 9161 / JW/IU-DC1) TaxID=756499 RepID=I4ACK3_DESDJ|nr:MULTISPECIES: hypothetical protein [Desulfitobacterium]AFM01688.1 hypothetical protein Desde_3404 [Desulfitobacterium dehalogenans ATCC 51507]
MIIIAVLSIERIWEDVDFFEIEVIAQSEIISASVRSYTTVASINELALRLATFPQKIDDRYIWENGDKGDDSTPYVSLEFWCEDKLGHIVIEVYMELDDGASYNKHNCCFFVKTEAGLLNSFGKSLVLLNEQGIGQKITL